MRSRGATSMPALGERRRRASAASVRGALVDVVPAGRREQDERGGGGDGAPRGSAPPASWRAAPAAGHGVEAGARVLEVDVGRADRRQALGPLRRRPTAGRCRPARRATSGRTRRRSRSRAARRRPAIAPAPCAPSSRTGTSSPDRSGARLPLIQLTCEHATSRVAGRDLVGDPRAAAPCARRCRAGRARRRAGRAGRGAPRRRSAPRRRAASARPAMTRTMPSLVDVVSATSSGSAFSSARVRGAALAWRAPASARSTSRARPDRAHSSSTRVCTVTAGGRQRPARPGVEVREPLADGELRAKARRRPRGRQASRARSRRGLRRRRPRCRSAMSSRPA